VPRRAGRGSRRTRSDGARELGERLQRYLDGDRDLALRRELAVHLELEAGRRPSPRRGRPEDLFLLLALFGVVALNIYFLLPEWTFRNMRHRAIRIALGNALLLALVSRIASPLLIAPAIAALSTMNLVFSPNYKTPRSAVLLAIGLSSAVLLSWLAEVIGAAPRTLFFTETTLVMESAITTLSPVARVILLVFFVVAVISAAAGMAFQNRKTERLVRERLHLQAWQLRQLVS
jgi:hypothetical protein